MRIVVRSEDVRAVREAQALLNAAGVDARALAGPYRPAPDGEDIAIFTATTIASAPRAQAEVALKTAPAPMAALVALPFATPAPIGLATLGPFQGAIALSAPPRLLAAQIEAQLRVAATEDELKRRRKTALDMGVDTAPTPAGRKLRVLYVGAPSMLFLSLERVLAEHDGLVAAAFSSFAGFDHLHDDAFDAVVLNGATNPQTALSLCSALRRNATLYHLPTMVIVAPGDRASAEAAIERGASAIVDTQASPNASLGWLFEAIRRERRRQDAETELRALRDRMGDPRTGLFQAAPFDAHLARLAGDHHASGRPLALAALRVMPAHGAREPEDSIWRNGFTEIAGLAARLMRETDSGTTLGRDLIIVALPGADVTGARRTAERIASVAECTAFAAGGGGAVPLIFEQSAVELQPGESAAGMLARALRAIEVESIPA